MRPFCVALTGGIGSGKSTVAAEFGRLGVTVVDTDVISRELTATPGPVLDAIVAAFGAGILDAGGALDRAALRDKAFSDPRARQTLEGILHPRIRQAAAQHLGQAGSPYVLLVVPLLTENLPAYRELIDRIAVVDCAESLQLQRVAARPGLNRELAAAILASQCSRPERVAIADDVIPNEGDLPSLTRQVADLHAQYLCLARAKTAPQSSTHCTK